MGIVGVAVLAHLYMSMKNPCRRHTHTHTHSEVLAGRVREGLTVFWKLSDSVVMTIRLVCGSYGHAPSIGSKVTQSPLDLLRCLATKGKHSTACVCVCVCVACVCVRACTYLARFGREGLYSDEVVTLLCLTIDGDSTSQSAQLKVELTSVHQPPSVSLTPPTYTGTPLHTITSGWAQLTLTDSIL